MPVTHMTSPARWIADPPREPQTCFRDHCRRPAARADICNDHLAEMRTWSNPTAPEPADDDPYVPAVFLWLDRLDQIQQALARTDAA